MRPENRAKSLPIWSQLVFVSAGIVLMAAAWISSFSVASERMRIKRFATLCAFGGRYTWRPAATC